MIARDLARALDPVRLAVDCGIHAGPLAGDLASRHATAFAFVLQPSIRKIDRERIDGFMDGAL